VEREGEEAHLAAEVNGLQLMVEGQTEFDHEERVFEELQLHGVHAEVHRLREEQETPKKLKGKKTKKTPSRTLRDEQRAQQRRAEAEKLEVVQAAELKFRAGVETTAGELAATTTSGAGLAKKQSTVFD
jgi:negative regulator of sigma E activity